MSAMFTGRQVCEELATELHAARRRIVELEADRQLRARHDSLTGHLSVRSFRTRLSEEVARGQRFGRDLSLALIDLDGFRALELRHGFKAGDELLVAVGERLRLYTRNHDVVCRTAGDEFAILLPETGSPTAALAFERLLLELEVLETSTVHCVTASVGIAELTGKLSAEGLLAGAAQALENARAAGGARVVCAPVRGAPTAERTPSPQRDAIEALAVALLERDRYTGEHSDSVVDMAGAVARHLGLAVEEIDRVRAAALLHDIGKVGIPDAVLHKAGTLDADEWELMREHPAIGERILRVVPGLGQIARIVRHEHERWDGTGYPDGLAGREIPMGSRIILACDAYHAMTSDRPYRLAMSHAHAVEELAVRAGAQFDPEVTAALIGHLYGRRQSGLGVCAA